MCARYPVPPENHLSKSADQTTALLRGKAKERTEMLHGVVGEHGPDLERLDSFGSEQSSEGRLTVGRLRFATSLLLLLGGSSSLAVPRQDGDQT